MRFCWLTFLAYITVSFNVCSRAGTILIYRNVHWHDMISIPSVQLSTWRVKVHVCFYCALSEQLPHGVMQTLTASWLFTMVANAGNKIVSSKNLIDPTARFGPISGSHVVWVGQWTTKLVCRLCNFLVIWWTLPSQYIGILQ